MWFRINIPVLILKSKLLFLGGDFRFLWCEYGTISLLEAPTAQGAPEAKPAQRPRKQTRCPVISEYDGLRQATICCPGKWMEITWK